MESATRKRPTWKRVIQSAEVATPGSWLSTLAYCAVAFPLFFLFLDTGSLLAILIATFFALWGVVGLVVMTWYTLEHSKFGEVNIVLAEQPVLGGTLNGRLALPEAAEDTRQVRVELHCTETREAEAEKGATKEQEVRVWYHEVAVIVRRDGVLRVAEFRLPIPDEPTVRRGVAYKWVLTIRANLPGIDLSRTFPIDVAQPPPGTPVRAPQERPSPAATPGEVADEAPSRSRAARWALVAANVVPLLGVLFWGWDVVHVLLVYWVETLIIGVVNVLRIAAAQPQQVLTPQTGGTGIKPSELPIVKALYIGFFVTHFGAFALGEGAAIAFVFEVDVSLGVLAYLRQHPALGIAALVLLTSHLVSFRTNYLNGGEYRRVNMAILMTRPYGRIFAMHLFIFAGAAAIHLLKAPALAMVGFVAIKMGIDYFMHQQERRILAETANVK